ncbi:MAG: hypothetical protein K2Z81_17235, partial [Cyanobacteria bacterium]|nr:hypothetical protein [Cyanobacteriota bacterium]
MSLNFDLPTGDTANDTISSVMDQWSADISTAYFSGELQMPSDTQDADTLRALGFGDLLLTEDDPQIGSEEEEEEEIEVEEEDPSQDPADPAAQSPVQEANPSQAPMRREPPIPSQAPIENNPSQAPDRNQERPPASSPGPSLASLIKPDSRPKPPSMAAAAAALGPAALGLESAHSGALNQQRTENLSDLIRDAIRRSGQLDNEKQREQIRDRNQPPASILDPRLPLFDLSQPDLHQA